MCEPFESGIGYGPARPPSSTMAALKERYGGGAALLIVGLLIGTVFCVFIAVNVVDQSPSSEQTFISGGSATVHLDVGASKVIYGVHIAERHNVDCTVKATAGSFRPPTIKRYDGILAIKHGEAIFTVTAHQVGNYVITCTGAHSDEFGVADSPNPIPFIVGRP